MKKEVLIFLVIGAVNSLNNWIISGLLALIIDSRSAFGLGYLAALIIGYFLNARFTFKKKTSKESLGKYMLSYLPNYLIQQLSVYLIVTLLEWHHLIAYVISAVIGIPLTFILLKFFAFAKGEKR